MADVERENNILKDGTVLKRLTDQLRELERENALSSNDKSTLEEYLRTENSRLEEDNASLRQSINEFVDQKIQWYDSLKENPLLKAQVIQLTEEVSQSRSHSEQLRLENSELQKQVGNSLAPDYEAIRDRTLNKLKMGRQSPQGKAIQAFIKELQHQEKPKPSTTTAVSLVTEAYERYKQGKFVHTDVYENALFKIAGLCGLKMFRDIKGTKFYITPQDNWGEKLVTSSSIGGMAEFLSLQPLLKPQ